MHLTVAVHDFPTLARNGFLYDDSFYDFQIARHIAQGDGPTFDGTHLTNGFQPLYVALLVPFYWITGSSETLPIHFALALSALLSVGTAYLLYRLLARRVSETAAVIAAAAWAFSPIVTRQTANGLETSLAVFMLAATVGYYLERVRGEIAPPRARFLVLGVLTGGAILARADLGFLALAMCLDYLLVRRARGAGARWRGDVGLAVGTCVVMLLPWLAYGTFAVGSPLPESGRATRFLGIAYAPFFGMGSASLAEDGPDASFVLAHVLRSIETFKVIPVFHPFFRGTKKFGQHVDQSAAMEVVTDVAGALLLLALAVWWVRRRRGVGGRPGREFEFLLVFAAMMIAAYSSVIFGVFFFLRYYYPLYFVGMVFVAFAIDDLIAWLRVRSVHARRAVLVASGAYAAALLFMCYTSAFRSTPVYRFYDAARWIRTHTDASDTIGVFQSGAIGYLSGRRVINLDGKVNSDAFDALHEGKLKDYVAAAGIDVVMDSANVLNLFLGPWSDAERERLEIGRVFTGGEYGVPGWIGYRVSPPRVLNAESVLPGSPRVQPDRAP